MKNKGLWIAIGIVVVVIIVVISSYNGLVKKNEGAMMAWSNVETA